jgi:hypothetical protein
MTNQDDIMKMAVVCNIQAIEKALGYVNPTCFEALWKTDLDSLRKIQDKSIALYNNHINANPI